MTPRLVTPLGPLSEYEEAEREARAIRNRRRHRVWRCGGARIGDRTRMQIVYAAIVAQPGITPKAIGLAANLDPSPVYVALKGLREGGYVESRHWCRHFATDKPAPSDRRGEWWDTGIRALAEKRRAA